MRYEKDKKRVKAIKDLVEIGILIPVDENLELYHGRSEYGEKEWKVLPNYNNSGVHGGHRNLYNIPTLSTTTDKEAAERYANLRAEEGGVPEVHRIVPYKKGVYILNAAYTYDELTDEKRRILMDSMRELSMFSVSELAPVKFEQRDKFQIVYDKLKKKHAEAGYYFISENDCQMVYNDLEDKNISEE